MCSSAKNRKEGKNVKNLNFLLIGNFVTSKMWGDLTETQRKAVVALEAVDNALFEKMVIVL